jgi:putative ABC transport system permease protein
MLVDAIRSLRAAPGLTLFVLLILSLTIAAATVTFSVVDAVVLRPMPFEDPDNLIVVEHQRGDGVMSQVRTLSAAEFLALRDRANTFVTLAAIARGSQILRSVGETEKVVSARVTASLFDVLRVRPLIGETFSAAHEVASNDRVALISHGLWHRRFAGDPRVVGQTIQVSDGPLVVVGVMPAGFTYPISDDTLTDVWTPYVIPEAERSGAQPSSYLHIVGRMRTGTLPAQAQIQADMVRATLAAGDQTRYRTGRFAVMKLEESVTEAVRGWMLLVLFAVGLLVLVACANVANLQLTRAIQRAREFAIRSALGATQSRLVLSLLIESLLLSISAVVIALLVSGWAVHIVKASLPPGIARAHLIALNMRVFGAAVAAALLTGLLFGVAPALHASRDDLVAVLKQGGTTVTNMSNRWRASVLVAEIALASVLLVGATLFISSFIRLTRMDLGFDRSNLIVATSIDGLQGTVNEVVQRLESIPGVVAAGGAAAGSPPLVAAGFGGGSSGTRLQLPNAPSGSDFVAAEFNRVSSRYFLAAGVPVLRGRAFGDADLESGAIVLDDLAARQLFGYRDPIGQDVNYGNSRATVIGVVGNVRMRGPEADTSPQAYFPGPASPSSYAYLVRTSRPARNVIPSLQATIATLRPAGSPPAQLRTVEEAFRNITARRRFSARLMAVFGILTMLIGAAGVYGVMSSVGAQRMREIAVRVALGATRTQIFSIVFRQTVQYITLGLVLGLPAAWLVSRTFSAIFFQVRSTDLWIYIAVAFLLASVGSAASFIPARRASLVDPLLVLRTE